MASPSKAKKKSADPQEVTTRLVLNFPGFEQTDSVAQLGRLRYGAEQTGAIWGFTISQNELDHGEGSHHTMADFTASGANWKVATRLVQFRWNDIVHAYERDRFPAGFLKNLRNISHFSPTAPSQIPKGELAVLGLHDFSDSAGTHLCIYDVACPLAAGRTMWLHAVLVPLATLLLCKWPGDRLYVPLTIADWGFARDMVHRTNPAIEDRFAEFGETLQKQIAASSQDEIIIVGHSFGSLWAVTALAQAMERDANLLKGKKVRFLALGSSLLKIALAKDATFMRDYWQSVMQQPEIFWHEVQTKDDLIAFYKCDPFEQVDIPRPKAEYEITRIRFSKGMEKKRYSAMRKSFYRTHRQYILYYDKRVAFDYMLRLFGPFSAKTLATDGGAHARIDENGTLMPPVALANEA